MSKEIRVVKREGKKVSEEAIWLSVNDIVGGYSEGKPGKSIFVFQTLDGEYIDANGVEHTLKLFEKIDGFVRTDRGAMANLNKVKAIDEKNMYLYIDEMKSRFITIAASRLEQVKKCILLLRQK
ncbi:hypothetical protein GRF59_14840 [Paenibacillus sp. HJL G12]|uniref:HTH LytTR-type domain-containing protein n=1 Tax=Paenibacillus dendrobii TaxID=2691084 RepID=A0A7X3IK90_9BACL|nr:hypothetical protein [Paenibacillus dendrobii]